MDERQFSYLQEMGISLWISRENSEDGSPESLQEVPVPANSVPVLQAEVTRDSAVADSAPQIEVLPSISESEQTPSCIIEAADESPLDWAGLQDVVSRCQRCSDLASRRIQTVFGVGNPQADWLIIGEAPGAEEDRRGEPFVGRAGQLLDAMLRAIGLNRSQVYIANILKCHPPSNRDPKPEEIEACSDYLQRQIELIKPKVVLVVGKFAAQTLLKSDAPVGKLRGQVHQFELPESPELKIPLVVTYHPAYLLRVPAEKAKAWSDLKLARSVCDK